VVTTINGQVTAQNRRRLAEAARHASVVAISPAHARSFGGVPVAAVIHHGIDLNVHKPGPGTGWYLLFVGRMSAGKGAHHAVRVARRAGWPAAGQLPPALPPGHATRRRVSEFSINLASSVYLRYSPPNMPSTSRQQ